MVEALSIAGITVVATVAVNYGVLKTTLNGIAKRAETIEARVNAIAEDVAYLKGQDSVLDKMHTRE